MNFKQWNINFHNFHSYCENAENVSKKYSNHVF